jgi:nitroimidazol reductase NimA-like FMN-containing flavoprotein (pyridoxamine 5'-phosphate oxidase superfamily)
MRGRYEDGTRFWRATDAFGDADARLVDRYGPNLRACGDESKTGQRVTRIFDPDFLVRPLHDTDNDIDGLLRARSDYDLFGLATNRTCGPQAVSNGLAQFQHAAWIGIAEVMSSKGAQRVLLTLARGYSGRLATVSEDGFPYCIPLLYLWMNGEVYLHTTSAGGYLRANIDRERRVCFQIDEEQGVFDYGRFECDSGRAYRSVCLFGRIRIVEDRDVKPRFCEASMAKYGKPEIQRAKGFFPRIDIITVHAVAVERMTGNEQALPPLSKQWPAKDRTKTPNASLRADGVKSSEETGPANS